MEIKQYSSLKEALDSTMNVDKTYIFVRHALIRGAVVNPHTHLKASEHIVISSGRFTLTVGDETKDFYLDNQPQSSRYLPGNRMACALILTLITS